ncbi:Putative Dol-P-Glc:Glc(2)Man(9)GlcNAc(2)-PP-Dol alpha-1,2-glucosyltransferase [Strongyloides ratti]|uniref:Dol-P-Glc:Glc(2)Man(9)GlcNAc(2)-PP-Dol alpha-1,2-glucosyltransferase n=1 Tax=Strongyloides ratti TaxID=34506 RepID=A0A090L6J1_STRRB|nr:Putative Dol-P-Glc:Glc(2)Man(9)GlcNAc(2)-PP-Dol alpha-1,2-glucosyltransferase [Strongyloides ratti]CEF65362.1 Putative Dol-P-Glc:Glc(2)Man(9)GlcNAc(2)-PP-Dol alpha-1,2-glucosyltransferase [Strongyloides ratti]
MWFLEKYILLQFKKIYFILMFFFKENFIAIIFCKILFIIHYYITTTVNKYVPEPYMDEIFHMDQNRRYCNGNFTWNNKITTPPAMYLLSYKFFCYNERYFNTFLYPLTFLALLKFRRRYFKTIESIFLSYLNVICVIILPVFFQSTTLYYTDQLSLISIVLAFNSNPYLATFFFTIAILTRQTNVVICLLYLGILFVKIIDIKNPISSLLKFLKKAFLQIILILLCILFVIFYNNGKIVLGDHSAHKPILHFPQIFYFMTFCSVSTLPFFIFSIKKNIKLMYKNSLLSIILLFIINILIYKYTYAHPYLLADNRHFTFYIWRRIINYHPYIKYVISPFYLLSFYYIINTLKKRIYPIIILGGFISLALCIVPAGLLEFRYFIVHFALWRLSIHYNSKISLIGELLISLIINYIVMYLFLLKPFIWSSEPNNLQRFMW